MIIKIYLLIVAAPTAKDNSNSREIIEIKIIIGIKEFILKKHKVLRLRNYVTTIIIECLI